MGVLDALSGTRRPRIFICYRRHGDGAGYGGRLADKLIKHFGKNQCFRDIENIETGVDFVDSINRAVGVCEVLIAVIGPDWTTQVNAEGKPRIQDPQDFVRLELGTALSRNIRIIPVLVGGADLPTDEELPADLQLLPQRQALELTDTRWEYDTDQLIKSIESIGIRGRSPAEKEKLSRRLKIAASVVLTSIFVVVGLALASLMFDQEPVQDTDRSSPPQSNEQVESTTERRIVGLSGSVQVFWNFQGVPHTSALSMDGEHGSAQVSFTDAYSITYTVQHSLQLVEAPEQFDFDYLLVGSRPNVPTYLADSFAAVFADGRVHVTLTCDQGYNCAQLAQVNGSFQPIWSAR